MKLRLLVILTSVLCQRNHGVLLAIILAGLSACGGIEMPNPMAAIKLVKVKNQQLDERLVFGVVSADDPAAVSVGNSILMQGGSAADAAAAMGFSISVTNPSRASLGGGGICLVGGGSHGKIMKALEFLPVAGTVNTEFTDRPSGIPTMVRGLAALHARYGRLPWQRILAPARSFAREGFLATRAFTGELKRFAPALFVDPTTRAIFSSRKGGPVVVGEKVRQIDLHTVLSTISGRGAGAFYHGVLAQRIIKAVRMAGGSLKIKELRNYVPNWLEPASVQVGNDVLYSTPPPTTAGLVAIQMLQMAIADPSLSNTTGKIQEHLLVEIIKRVNSEHSKWLETGFGGGLNVNNILSAKKAKLLMQSYSKNKPTSHDQLFGQIRSYPEIDGSTSYIVVDDTGLAVACSLTLNHPFGVGRIAPGLGIILAAAPKKKYASVTPIGPVIVTGVKNNVIKFVFASAGGLGSATALGSVMINIYLGKVNLDEAIKYSRFHYDAVNDKTVVEDHVDGEIVSKLETIGHKIHKQNLNVLVNIIVCKSGLPSTQPVCKAKADPRGSGVSTIVKFFKKGGP